MTHIMYIERKAGDVTGNARIGKVKFSKTGRSMYYGGKSFIKVIGYKYNCIEEETGEAYWISGCKKNGCDSLYAQRPVLIDEDIREEYWMTIRHMPYLKYKCFSH
ncbi:hypothetical protein [Mucilaginibacter sp. PAMB04168]|uniref:hypothetical protein n=1 Tax=Mucilaginibacter sp. PAMB04168 TaxID=3138567 RepID=UPI0031F6F27A